MKIPYFCCIGAELKRYQKDFDFMNQVYLYKIPTDDTLEEVLAQDYFQAIADTVLQDDLLYIYEPTAQALHMCRFNKQGGHITAVQLSNNVPGLTPNRVLISDSTGHIAAGDVTLEYLKNKVNLDGTSIMTGPLKMRSSVSFKCAIAPSWDGVGFYKLNDNDSVTLMASMESTDGLTPAQNNTYNFGTSSRKWKDAYIARVITAVINNGFDIAVPVTNSPDTLALKSEVDNAANSGRMITDEGVWFAKMYAASVVPTGAEYDGKNYADFSQTDGDGNPVIKIYTGASGAWTLTDTITPPANYDGYVPVTKKIWDILDQTGQQGGRILWNHQSKTFTPFPNMVSFEDAALTGTPTAPTPTGASPNNQIANKDYVNSQIAASAATKANVGMNNLTSTGKNIANWSSNVSNCITNIPQDIKLELNTTTHSIILKAGSKVYVPNGNGVYNELVIANDLTLGPVGTATYSQLLYVTSDGTAIATGGSSVSGTSVPASYSGYYWNVSTNKINSYNSGTVGPQCSLPIAQIHRTSGNWDSIEIVFNGFGYMGSTEFALPGVYGLVPDGKNPDGTLKSIVAHTENVLIYTFGNSVTANVYMSFKSPDANGIWTELDFKIDTQLWRGTQTSYWYYNRKTNYWSWNSDTSYNWIDCAFMNVESGVISNFGNNGYIPSIDINDPKYIAFNAMPSGKYDTLTLGASGNVYTAPANGWFSLGGNDSESGNCRYVMRNNNTRFGVTSNSGGSSTTTGWLTGILPVKKNDKITIYYTGFTSAGVNFLFFYANGEL